MKIFISSGITSNFAISAIQNEYCKSVRCSSIFQFITSATLLMFLLTGANTSTSVMLPFTVQRQLDEQGQHGGVQDELVPLDTASCHLQYQSYIYNQRRITCYRLHMGSSDQFTVIRANVMAAAVSRNLLFVLPPQKQQLRKVDGNNLNNNQQKLELKMTNGSSRNLDTIGTVYLNQFNNGSSNDIIIPISTSGKRLLAAAAASTNLSITILFVLRHYGQLYSASNLNHVAFLVGKRDLILPRLKREANLLTRSRRVQRCGSMTSDNDNNQMTSCCLKTVNVAPAIILGAANHSKLIAPKSIPVTFCIGHCQVHMLRGNHNVGLIRYHNHLSDTGTTVNIASLRLKFPCCSARQFSDLKLLYQVQAGRYRMVNSVAALVTACDCV